MRRKTQNSPKKEKIMEPFETNDYLVRLLDHNDSKALREVQKLRYDYLLRDFDQNKNDLEGLDDDGYDDCSDSILVIDKKAGRIAGTYRVASAATLKGLAYKCEEEFDISALKADPDGILEAGRAVVHEDYRNGTVIGLLWKGLINYANEHHLRYIFGTCSLHGTDPGLYERCTSYLNQYALSDKFEIRAACQAFEYGTLRDLSMHDADMPGLLRAYLQMGASVSQNGFIDYEFNSCDVMVILDCQNLNRKFVNFFLR